MSSTNTCSYSLCRPALPLFSLNVFSPSFILRSVSRIVSTVHHQAFPTREKFTICEKRKGRNVVAATGQGLQDSPNMSHIPPASAFIERRRADDVSRYEQAPETLYQAFSRPNPRQTSSDRIESSSGIPKHRTPAANPAGNRNSHATRLMTQLPISRSLPELRPLRHSPMDSETALQNHTKPVPEDSHPACLTPGNHTHQKRSQASRSIATPAQISHADSHPPLDTAARQLSREAIPFDFNTGANSSIIELDAQTPSTTLAQSFQRSGAAERRRRGHAGKDRPRLPLAQEVRSRDQTEARPVTIVRDAGRLAAVDVPDKRTEYCPTHENAAMEAWVALWGDGYRAPDARNHTALAGSVTMPVAHGAGTRDSELPSGRQARRRGEVGAQSPPYPCSPDLYSISHSSTSVHPSSIVPSLPPPRKPFLASSPSYSEPEDVVPEKNKGGGEIAAVELDELMMWK